MADYDDNAEEHPALAKLNRAGVVIKHVLGKALKWAAVAAVVGGILIGAAALFPAGIVGGLNLLTFGGLEWLGITTGTEIATGGFTSGILYGGLAGAALGTVSGLGSAGEAIQNAEEDCIANCDRREARQERLQALERQRMQQYIAMQQQAQQMGMTPNVQQFGRQAEGPMLG